MPQIDVLAKNEMVLIDSDVGKNTLPIYLPPNVLVERQERCEQVENEAGALRLERGAGDAGPRSEVERDNGDTGHAAEILAP